MEDILSSIRRVIARDEAPGAARGTVSAENDDILDLSDAEPDNDPPEPTPPDEDLVSSESADAARQSLEALTAAVTPVAAAAIASAPSASGRSIEDVVIDALRPMLKEWLDSNLPALVEAMVAKEISRIAGKQT